MNSLPTEFQKTGAEASVEVPKPVIDLGIYVMPAFATRMEQVKQQVLEVGQRERREIESGTHRY